MLNGTLILKMQLFSKPENEMPKIIRDTVYIKVNKNQITW